MAKKRVLIDTDPATGVSKRDVDDGLAILLMIAAPEITVEGITVVFGNVKAPVGYQVTRELLEVAKVDIPFFKGAESRHDLGKMNPAVEFLIKTVRDNPGEISLLTIGPLTNVATAMMLDPEFAPNLAELVVMGGSLKFKPFSYFGEFNFHCDGKAASLVASAPVRKTMITMDLCSQAVFKKEHLKRFQENDSQVSRYLARHIPPWLKINRIVFFRKGGFFPWDVVAAAHLIDDSLFDDAPHTFKIREEGARRGSIFEFQAQTDYSAVEGAIPVNVPRKLESDRFMKLFIDGLLTL
ncbi:MAG: nucleoside hydrolase [Proteobacteria bacterium]|nr:nucleoside hydrolase [Pseudomonadota bacterium]